MDISRDYTQRNFPFTKKNFSTWAVTVINVDKLTELVVIKWIFFFFFFFCIEYTMKE